LRFIGILHDSAEAEIAQLCHTLLEQNIRWLYIPMNNVLLQQGEIPLRKMPHEGLRLGLTQTLILSILFQIVLEVAVLAILKHHVNVLPRSEIVVELDDEGRLQRGQIFNLVLNLLLNALIDLLYVDALDSHLNARVVLPVEHRPSCTGPQRM